MRSAAPALLAVALAGTAEHLELGARSPIGPWPFALGCLLLGFWLWTACRVGATAAARLDPRLTDAGDELRRIFYAIAYALLTIALFATLQLIDPLALTLFHALVFVALRDLPQRPLRRLSAGTLTARVAEHPITSAIVAIVATLALCNLSWALLSPFHHPDDFSYHLVFPLDWSQSGSLGNRLIPFGNHSPSYHPKNIELLYTWLLLPLRRLEPVVLLQGVFLAGGTLAIYDILRLCRASASSALLAASLYLLSPVITKFLNSGYVDFASTFLFLMSLSSLLALRGKPSWGRWIELWLALGLFAGTKSFGILLTMAVLVPVGLLLLVPRLQLLARLTTRAWLGGAALALALWTAAGGWWYLRNILETGNPIFPLEVELLGRPLFEGAYPRDAFPRAFAGRLLQLFPTPLWVPIAIGAVVSAYAALRAKRDETPAARQLALLGIATPAILTLLFCYVLPTGFARFVLPIAPLSTAVLVVPLQARSPLGRGFALLILLAVLASLGRTVQREALLLPLSPAEGLVPSALVWSAFALGVVALALALSMRILRWPARLWSGLAAGALGAAGLAAAMHTTDPAGSHLSKGFQKKWAPYLFIEDEYGAVKIAVTGTNQSLRAFGSHLASRPRYVNINATGDSLFHEQFLNHYRSDPVGGVLGSEKRRGERRSLGTETDLSGAVYYRSSPDYESWLRNLAAAEIDLVAIAQPPSRNRKQPYRLDADGFPLEAGWAAAHPERFSEAYVGKKMRIYEFHATEAPKTP